MTRRRARENLAAVTPDQWEAARERERVFRPLIRDGGWPGGGEVANAARQLGISVQWARSLLRRFIADPRISTLLPDKGGRPQGVTVLDRRVEAIIAERIRTHYATPQRPPFRVLVEAVADECRRQQFPAPTAKTVKRRLYSIDPTIILAKREGGKVALARHGPAKARFEPASRPLQLVQIDHTLADLIVVDEAYREPVGRPWLTLAIDVFSRVIAGYHVTLEAPSSLSVALCLAHVVSDKAPWLTRLGIDAVWPSGMPEAVHLDNAAEFHAAALVRGCEEHGIAVHHRPVATPHYGGHVERLVGTVMGEVHLLPGTTFSNIAERGTYDSDGRAVMTLSEFDTWLARQVAVLYHGDIHRGIERTPLGAWNSAVAAGASVRAVPDPDRLRIDFLPAEHRQPRRDGVELFKIGYWHDALPKLAARGAGKLPVRYDPRDLSRVWLRPLGEDAYLELRYKDLRQPPVTLWEWRAARKHLLAQGRREIDAAARFEAVEAQRRLIAEAAQKTRAARRTAERTAQAGITRRGGNPAKRPADGGAPLGIDYSQPPEILEVEEWS